MAARGRSQVDRSVNLKPAEDVAQRLGTTVKQISRWAKELDDPDRFEGYFEKCCAKYSKILELDMMAHVGQNSGENEWYTPAEIVEAARAVLGSIDLDPASTDAANAVIKAEQIYTLNDNALEQQWDGLVWMNPPYSQPLIEQFCEKLAASVEAGTVPAAVVLVNNASETQWFKRLVSVATAICFPFGRVRFWSPDKESATPLQGQAVVYIGPEVDAFDAAFMWLGFRALEIRP